jgi:uncharacterized membrane protein
MDLIAYADSIDNFIFKINAQIINPIIEFAFLVAFVIFLYGVMEFVRGADNQDKRTAGKNHMLYGIIGFVIMFGVFGIISILTSTFGINGVKIDKNQQTLDLDRQNIQQIKIGE